MKPQIVKLLTCVLLLTILSCKKKMNEGPPSSSSDVRDSTHITEEKKAILNREIGTILEKVYQNDSARTEVNMAIFSGYYEDERVPLYDLLYPGTTAMYDSEKFRRYTHFIGEFSRLFFEVMSEGKYPELEEVLLRPLPKKHIASSATVANDVVIFPTEIATRPATTVKLTTSIYFPYSENFEMQPSVRPTIVAATADTDEGPGREPNICIINRITTICYSNVMVNDDYATRRPVHIVTDGAEPSQPTYPEPVANKVNRVYLGWSKLSKQLDKFISLTGNGGGSEIKVCRINGYLEMKDDHIDNFEGDIVTLNYKRSDIRKGRWKRVYSVWEPNWNYQDIEQIYAVYEEDNKGEASFSGSLNTTLSVPGSTSAKVNGEIGFKISVKTQDQLVTQRKLDRNSFFKSAGINQGFGYYDDPNDFLNGALDWPIYDGGTIWSYTMPFRVF